MLTCLIFRGTGKRISHDERAQYDPDVFVIFQPKAWMDGTALDEWTEKYGTAYVLRG